MHEHLNTYNRKSHQKNVLMKIIKILIFPFLHIKTLAKSLWFFMNCNINRLTVSF